ncbi:hypothetical protein A7E78_08865 [Syntrophotalea acetylenivorans]|uniref:C-type lysozyme inhibitor domain-containing protein n=1 Tax=Syntrophotalea acetylenivorans TaxID=1842532 RepID=A0A1L3GPR5_9BACT|nr:hypothetical protein [Syntrophotalea acetylenivorans]APG27936.1 hypothetical protein A7E78_08865 [Syntrophotalea acetylenivorans]
MKTWQIFAAVLLSATLSVGNAQADTRGVKRFACIEMRWLVPDGSETVSIEFVQRGESFARLTISPQERFRQFNFSTDAILAEGRMRLHLDKEQNKGILNLDSLSYRCYGPAEQAFSGPLMEFDLPVKP